MATMSAREFNRDVSAAKRAASEAPVVITDRGEAAFVLLSISDYRDLQRHDSLIDALSMSEGDDFDVAFEPLDLSVKPMSW